MTETIFKTLVRTTQLKRTRGTSTNFAAVNPVLALGEEGEEINTGKTKTGDGATAWNDLAYNPGSIAKTSIACVTSFETPTKLFTQKIVNKGCYMVMKGTLSQMHAHEGDYKIGTKYEIDIHLTRSKDIQLHFDSDPAYENGRYLMKGDTIIGRVIKNNSGGDYSVIAFDTISPADELISVLQDGYQVTYEGDPADFTEDESFTITRDAEVIGAGVIHDDDNTSHADVVLIIGNLKIGDVITGLSSGAIITVTAVEELSIQEEIIGTVTTVTDVQKLSYASVKYEVTGPFSSISRTVSVTADDRGGGANSYVESGTFNTYSATGELISLKFKNADSLSFPSGLIDVEVDANAGTAQILVQSGEDVPELNKWVFTYDFETDDDNIVSTVDVAQDVLISI